MSENTLQPLMEVKRHPCPFYRFHAFKNSLADTYGNECPLVSLARSTDKEKHISPCYMEIGGETPNWNKCIYKNSSIVHSLEEHADEIQVFPGEFQPSKTGSWEGITFRQWYAYVMGTEITA